MIKKVVRFFLFVLLTLATLQAERVYAESYELKASKVELTVPSEWQKSVNFLDNPLTLFGPTREGESNKISSKRAAWIFSDAPKGKENLNKKELEEKQNDYFTGRLKWMARRGATLIDKIPYTHYRTRKNIEIHQIGVTYRLAGVTYSEESLFFLCGNTLVNISRLTPERDKSALEKDYTVIMNSMSCSEL